MAGFSIHLAIAKRHIEKNKTNNEIDLYKGVIDPDLVDDKNISHYTNRDEIDTLYECLKFSAGLYEFLKDNNIETDYNKGIFIHLLTDYLFFNTFLDKNYMLNAKYEDFPKDLYYSYDKSNEYIEKKYNISSIFDNVELKTHGEKIKNDYKPIDGEYNLLIDENKIYEFIEFVSDIDLEKYKDKILENKCNILP